MGRAPLRAPLTLLVGLCFACGGGDDPRPADGGADGGGDAGADATADAALDASIDAARDGSTGPCSPPLDAGVCESSGSGVGRSTLLTELASGERVALCEWITCIQGGAGRSCDCGDGVAVTIDPVSECLTNVWPACSVGSLEDCVAAQAEDLCALAPTECGAFYDCAGGVGLPDAGMDAGGGADAGTPADAATDSGPSGDAGTDAGVSDAGTDAGAPADAGACAGDAGTFSRTTTVYSDSASSGTPDTYFIDVVPCSPFDASITGGGSGAWTVNASDGTSSGVFCSGSSTCSFTVPGDVSTILLTAVTTDIGAYTMTAMYAAP